VGIPPKSSPSPSGFRNLFQELRTLYLVAPLILILSPPPLPPSSSSSSSLPTLSRSILPPHVARRLAQITSSQVPHPHQPISAPISSNIQRSHHRLCLVNTHAGCCRTTRILGNHRDWYCKVGSVGNARRGREMMEYRNQALS
jgi:hypothetical protein